MSGRIASPMLAAVACLLACARAPGGGEGATTSPGPSKTMPASFTCPERSEAFPFADRFASVAPRDRSPLRLRYVEAGAGDDVFVLVHGIPASVYLWRNVIPGIAKVGRVIALDLPGFGRSERPAHTPGPDELAAYLGAFLDHQKLDRVILVVHDLGSVAGLLEAATHPERVRGIVLLEALVPNMIPASLEQSPSGCTALQPDAPACFWLFARSPAGQTAITEQNLLVEAALGGDPICPPTPGAMAVYREPFADRASRAYLAPYPGLIPVDGEPGTIQPLLDRYARWLETSRVPKLVLAARPGFLITPAVAAFAKAHFPNTDVADLGPGIHFLQETNPSGIADAIATWYRTRLR
jgi:haloalkane dehalogenase